MKASRGKKFCHLRGIKQDYKFDYHSLSRYYTRFLFTDSTYQPSLSDESFSIIKWKLAGRTLHTGAAENGSRGRFALYCGITARYQNDIILTSCTSLRHQIEVGSTHMFFISYTTNSCKILQEISTKLISTK